MQRFTIKTKNKVPPTYWVDQSLVCGGFSNFMEACGIDVCGPSAEIEAIGLHVTGRERGDLNVVVNLL